MEAYGVWQETNIYGKKSMGVVQTTYIIEPEVKITPVFPGVKFDGHCYQVLRRAVGGKSQNLASRAARTATPSLADEDESRGKPDARSWVADSS
jgi:hypothetical protein